MVKTKSEPGGGLIPLSALLISIAFLLAAYQPLLAPLANPQLQFRYGDFTTIFGEESGELRAETTFYSFGGGHVNTYENRLFTLAMFSGLSEFFPFSDTQFHASLILLSMLLGCIGLYFLVLKFEKRPYHQAALIIFLLILYFLNFWAADRLAHTWIWFTYAIFPLFIFLGLEFLSGGKHTYLVLYSLVLGFFGFLPHSFMYLVMIHGILAVYSLLIGKGWKNAAVFAAVPALIYLGINLPSLVLFPYLGQGYPVSLENVGPRALSENGELMNLLAFSNQWWPQEEVKGMIDNPLFRYSGILIFVATLLILIRSADRMEKQKKWLVLVSAAAMLFFMFMAQGTNNQILEKTIRWVMEHGLTQLIAPFREWARISLLIPVFSSIIIMAGISSLREPDERIFLAAFLILLALNVAWSPSWIYIQKSYAAKVQHPDNFRITDIIDGQRKVIFLEGTTTVQNFFRFPQYPAKNEIGKKSESEELTGRLLDAYSFGYVIKDEKAEGLGPDAYDWLDCKKLETAEVCINHEGTEDLKAYSGAIASSNPGKYADPILFASGGKMVTATEDYGSEYFIGRLGNRSGRQVFILEGEADLRTAKGQVSREWGNVFSSGGALVMPNAVSTALVNVSKQGAYTLAFLGKGTIDARIGGNNQTLSSDGNGFVYSVPMALERGLAQLQVSAQNDTVVDSIWIFDGTGTVGGLLGPASSPEVISQERIDPTLWTAEVDAREPFVLSLAEPYSRLFEARVTDESGKLTRIAPVDILGGINGFPINSTGKLEIEVRFVPQETYAPAFISTWITLLCCFGYLGFAWWKHG